MRFLIFLSLLLVSLTILTQLNSIGNAIASNISDDFVATGLTKDGWAWASVPWTASDTKYARIRKEIDASYEGALDKAALYQQYKNAALANPHSAEAQFAWGYFGWKLAPSQNSDILNPPALRGVPEALADVPFPNDYNYARLRFLVQTYLHSSKKLQALGKRLLDQVPDDYDVKYQYVRILAMRYDPDQLKSAIPYLEQLIKTDPNKPKPYSALGVICLNICTDSHYFDPVYVDKGVAAFKTYLKLAPNDDGFRPIAEQQMKGLQKYRGKSFP